MRPLWQKTFLSTLNFLLKCTHLSLVHKASVLPWWPTSFIQFLDTITSNFLPYSSSRARSNWCVLSYLVCPSLLGVCLLTWCVLSYLMCPSNSWCVLLYFSVSIATIWCVLPYLVTCNTLRWRLAQLASHLPAGREHTRKLLSCCGNFQTHMCKNSKLDI